MPDFENCATPVFARPVKAKQDLLPWLIPVIGVLDAANFKAWEEKDNCDKRNADKLAAAIAAAPPKPAAAPTPTPATTPTEGTTSTKNDKKTAPNNTANYVVMALIVLVVGGVLWYLFKPKAATTP